MCVCVVCDLAKQRMERFGGMGLFIIVRWK